MKRLIDIPKLKRALYFGGHDLIYRFTGPIERMQARRNQARYVGTLVAVTGSCGKSTTTNLAARLLGEQGKARLGLYWNTARRALRQVRKLSEPVDFVVQEVSGHQPGALDETVSTLRIDIAVVTAVGLDHLVAFRTPEAVAAEKGKLVAAVRETGIACLNADDPLVRGMAERCRGRVILYGRSPDAEVRAENVSSKWPERLSFDLVVGDRRIPVHTRFVSTLMLTNLLAALAVVHAAGKSLELAAEALAELEPLPERMSVATGFDQHAYVKDTFKASFWSARRLVEDLDNWGPERRIVVMGDLSDMGNDSQKKYRQILRAAAARAALVVGAGHAAGSAERLKAAGVANIVAAGSLDEIRAILAAQPPSLVLLKCNKSFPLCEIFDDRPAVTAAA